jgi:hypothetical protein
MRSYILVFLCISLISCKEGIKKTPTDYMPSEMSTDKTGEMSSGVIGNYANENYSKREEGLDWVGVMVTPNADESLRIRVRSRADIKRPTCTFDAKAYKTNESTYKTVYDGQNIQFQFSQDGLTISTEDPNSSDILNFFCNGGATIAGTYHKINEELDPLQVDQTLFHKVLKLQGIGFNIASTGKDGKNALSISTFGLEERDFNETFNIDGELVMDAEVEDLNSDGSPELLIFTQTTTEDKIGNVYAFSVNNRKSMSQVYFQPTTENSKINQGYRGNDQFSVVETFLGQRFPIYKDQDSGAVATGMTRQVS